MTNQTHKTHVLLTIDTEFSMGGYAKNHSKKPVPADRIIYCKYGKKEYGITRIMDILERFGLRGVFFVEVEARFYFGEKQILEIIHCIQERGHEIQIHTHPNFRTFKNGKKATDDIRKCSVDYQYEILQEAMEFLSRNGVHNIVSHRSGGFYSNSDTLMAQKKCGLKFISNYNISVPNCRYIDLIPGMNDIFKIDYLFEIPITCFKEFPLRKKWNSFQLSAASFREIRKALEFYYTNKVTTINFITHSFEFVKKYDDQYNNVKVLPFLIRRFENICSYLANNQSRFEIITFEKLSELLDSKTIVVAQRKHPFYKSSFKDTLLRYLSHFMCSG